MTRLGAKHKMWTNHEVKSLIDYRSKGYGIKHIARLLQRGCGSVRSYLHNVGDPKPRRPTTTRSFETLVVPKSDVVSLYEAGWRFDGFSTAGLCIMTKERAPQFLDQSHNIGKAVSIPSADSAKQLGAVG